MASLNINDAVECNKTHRLGKVIYVNGDKYTVQYQDGSVETGSADWWTKKSMAEEIIRKSLSSILEASTGVHPDGLHVTPVTKNGIPHYKVKAVGKNFAHGIKVGEHLTDTELDDFHEMGGKIKHIKEAEESDDDEASANKHIIPQLHKAVDAKDTKGGADVTFNNGKTHFVKSEHAEKVVNALSHPALKPEHKAEAAAHVAASHDNFIAVHNMLK
jgi:hypothetical protein